MAVFTPPIICPSPSRVNSATLLSLLIDQHRIHLSGCCVGNARGLLNIEMFSGFGKHFFLVHFRGDFREDVLKKNYSN